MSKKPIAVSLFSGAGGLDIGLEQAGFEIRCAVEWNRYACETLRTNQQLSTATDAWFSNWFSSIIDKHYSRWESKKVNRLKKRTRKSLGHSYLRDCAIIEDDIRRVSSSIILEAARVNRGEIDLIAGGPPCQSFSRSGKRESVDDDRGQLFVEFVRIVKDVQPRWFLFENVKGLILTKTTIWKVLCEHCGFEEIPPFDPEREAPNSADASPPCVACNSKKTHWKIERNKRAGALELIIAEFERIGYRCDPFVLNAVDYGAPQNRERLFIVGSRDNERIKKPIATHFSIMDNSIVASKDSVPLQKQKTVWEALFTSPNPDHHWPLDRETAVLWVKNVVRPHDEPVTWSLLRPSPTIGAHQSAKLAIAPFGVPLEQLARQQWHVLGKRQGDTKPVPVVHTYLSDTDLLALQTFPDFWFVAGTRMERAFQIGNAVPPLLARIIGLAILAAGVLNGETTKESAVQDSSTKTQQLSLFKLELA